MTGRQKVMMICEKMNIIAWIFLTLVKKDLVSKWWLHQIKSLLKSSNEMLYIFHNLELIFVVRRPHFRHKLMAMSDSLEIIVFFKKGFILSLFCHVQFFLQLMIKTLQITKAERTLSISYAFLRKTCKICFEKFIHLFNSKCNAWKIIFLAQIWMKLV